LTIPGFPGLWEPCREAVLNMANIITTSKQTRQTGRGKGIENEQPENNGQRRDLNLMD